MCSFDFSLGHHVTAENRNLVENTSRQNYCTHLHRNLQFLYLSVLQTESLISEYIDIAANYGQVQT